MIRILSITAILMVATIGFAASAEAGCYSYVDQFGNTSIRCDNGARGNLYTDPYGNTSGSIGGQRYNTYTDPYGNTSGSIGGQRFNCYTDTYGNTTCR